MKELKNWSFYLLEAGLLYIVFLPVHYYWEISPVSFIITLLAATLAGQGLMMYLTPVKSSLFAVPLVTVTASISGYPLLAAVFLALLLFWRHASFKIGRVSGTVHLISTALILGIPYYLVIQSFEVVGLLIIYLAIVIMASFIFLAAESSSHRADQWRSIFSSSSVIALCISMSALILLMYPYILRLLSWTVSSIIQILLLLMTPFFLMMDALPDHDDEENSDSNEFEEEEQDETALFPEQSDSLPPEVFTAIAWILGICAAVWLLYFIIKRLSDDKNDGVITAEGELISDDNSENAGWIRKHLFSRPDHTVRRLFLSLEKSYRKKGFARQADETAEEWVGRLPYNEDDKRHIVKTYQNVRYGQLEPSPRDLKNFRTIIKSMKQEAGKQGNVSPS